MISAQPIMAEIMFLTVTMMFYSVYLQGGPFKLKEPRDRWVTGGRLQPSPRGGATAFTNQRFIKRFMIFSMTIFLLLGFHIWLFVCSPLSVLQIFPHAHTHAFHYLEFARLQLRREFEVHQTRGP